MIDATYNQVKSDISGNTLSDLEFSKRTDLLSRKPHVAKKLAENKVRQDAGFPTPVIRLADNMLCNFQCTHCCAEHYMDLSLIHI